MGAGFLAVTVAHGEKPVQEQSVLQGLYPVERTLAGVGKKCEEKEAAETVLRTDCKPHSHPLALLWGKEVEESGIKE